jgi:hypothetical protein
VYRGQVLSSLVPVTGQNYSGEVAFYAQAGMSYQIAVSVPPGTEYEGVFSLSLKGPPLPPEVIASSSGIGPDGYFQLGIAGQTGQSFVVQASSDLLNWENVTTDTLNSSMTQFLDLEAGKYQRRFYRAVSLDSLLQRQPLRIRSCTLSTSGFRLALQGNPADSYVVEASTNLVDWIPAASGIIYGNAVEWTDPVSLLLPNRFYRLVPLP